MVKRKLEPTEMYRIPGGVDDAQPTIARVDELSKDGRRISRKTHLCYAPSHSNTTFNQPASFNTLNDDAYEFEPPLADMPVAIPDLDSHNMGRFTSQVSDEALLEWKEERQQILHELLRHEGLCGVELRQCPNCPPTRVVVPTYRCRDCFAAAPLCRQCCVDAHASAPFHRIKRWTGVFFDSITLRDMGLVVQLGHPLGQRCMAPMPAPRDFLVIHTNGMHPLNVQYCHCSHSYLSGSRIEQLMRMKLYPATVADPNTCCTFDVLENFHIVTLQSKVTMYDYYMSMEKLTDNTGLKEITSRLKPFIRMVREWRHLKALKRAGRAHELEGVKGTKAGDLIVKCPACPCPGFNLPDNWKTVADELKFIYTLFVAIDANFRLKRRTVSNETRDPALGSGWGYFVSDREYREYLLGVADQKDISTCTGFAALMHANTKWSKGYATTGVAMCVCARHGFILPNGVGDLQKGERYCNIDYIWASTYQHTHKDIPKVVSYDIACQWEPHLLERLKTLPDHVRIEIPEGSIRYAIPKYHFMGHKGKNHHQFSFNMKEGVGRTDGEEIERSWSRHDDVSGSVREMGPGSRHDTLEDHFSSANWQKTVGLGKLLQKRLTAARKDAVKYKAEFDDFKADLQEQHVQEWLQQVQAWEKDTSLDDPYDLTPSGPTEAEIRAQLSAEEERAASAEGSIGLHSMGVSGMMSVLLEIEDQQRRLRQKFPREAKLNATQLIDVSEKRVALRRRLNAIRTVQVIYMPVVAQLAAQHSEPNQDRTAATQGHSDLPEYTPLFCPLSLSLDQQRTLTADVLNGELLMREGQMRSALDTLRTHLHIKSRLVRFKAQNVRHQAANTRAHEKLAMNEVKVTAAREKYQAAWNAKMSYTGPGDWTKEWRQLKREDVRCLVMDNGTNDTSEGRRSVSWIWMAADTGNGNGDQPGLNEALRVEFLKSRARALRFAEEVQLLLEEQSRVLRSLRRTELIWQRRAELAAAKESIVVRQGVVAYAARQRDLYKQLHQRFSQYWTNVGLANRGNDGGNVIAAEDNLLDGAGPLFTIAQDDSDDEDGLAGLKVLDDEDD